MDYKKTSIQGLPPVQIDGVTFYIRKLGELESHEVMDDVMRFARQINPDSLKGEAPNPLKRLFVKASMESSDLVGMIGNVDLTDAHSVGMAHTIILRLVAFQLATAMLTEDGSDAFPTFEDKVGFTTLLLRRDDLAKAVSQANAMLTANEAGDTPNDLPAV